MSFPPPTLVSRSGRLTLVPPSRENDSFVAALRSHPDTRCHIPSFLAVFTEDDARALRLKRADDPTRITFHIHLSKSAGAFVGTASITHIDTTRKSCDIGILVSAEYARGGYATEAIHALLEYIFEERKWHRVAFSTAVSNIAMRGWLDMAGTIHEGTLRGAWPLAHGDGFLDVCL
ncbi:Ribosomal-protein-alanine acetyltransferase [Mycena kentingensis (nom. inval.)]|nr:Ribosomal-protein-alanine acetyltransferase [Mycena kentingensis (nom. inval.)]